MDAPQIADDVMCAHPMEGESDSSLLLWMQREYAKLMRREAEVAAREERRPPPPSRRAPRGPPSNSAGAPPAPPVPWGDRAAEA